MSNLAKTFRKIVVKPETYGDRNFQNATAVKVVNLLEPSENQIQVKVTHTGIEASDIVQMVGGYGALAGKKPVSSWNGSVQIGDMGCEGVGVITAIGSQVTQFNVNEAVAFPGSGISFREYTLIDVVADSFGTLPAAFKIPAPTPEWTAVPISAFTATGGLEQACGIRRGQNVLITAASGGTGHIAVQWAKKVWGCRVAGTCGSPAKAQMLKDLGCDVVVNYREDDVEAVLRREFPDGFDCIYEAVGGKIGNIARRCLAPNGFLAQIGYVSTDYSGATTGQTDGKQVRLKKGQKEMFYFVGDYKGAKKTRESWDNLVKRTITEVAQGTIKIVMDKKCEEFQGIEGVYQAQARMREGKNIGKIYATINPEYAMGYNAGRTSRL